MAFEKCLNISVVFSKDKSPGLGFLSLRDEVRAC